MKKIYNVFFKQLKNKKIVAMVVAFTFLIPNLTILFHAESPNLADISVNTKLTASASVNNGDAPGAFRITAHGRIPTKLRSEAEAGNGLPLISERR